MWGSNDLESMSSNRWLMESGGARSAGVPACRYFGRWEGHFDMIAVFDGPKQTSRVSIMHVFPSTPGVWGPNQARIASDRRDLLSRLLFVDTRVDSELSSNCTWRVGESSSSSRIVWLPEGNSMFPWKDTSSVCLEAIRWLWGCRLWEGLADDIWARNSSFSFLSHLVWWIRDYIYQSFLRWRISMPSHQSK